MIARLEDAAARLQDRELETDREGRGFSHNSAHRHGMDGERSTHRHQQEVFSRRIAQEVDGARVKHAFDKLILVAQPRMLGLIREALPDAARPLVVAEVPKDLVHVPPDEIPAHLPEEVMRLATSELVQNDR